MSFLREKNKPLPGHNQLKNVLVHSYKAVFVFRKAYDTPCALCLCKRHITLLFHNFSSCFA